MKEKRIYKLDNLEIRADDGQPPRLIGHAAVFNRRSVDLGGFTEVIEPGAFSSTLQTDPDVRATIDHEGGLNVLGRTRSGTLRLAEDAQGLRVEIDLPDTTAGRDARTLVDRQDIDQMSFMFRVPKDGDSWLEEENGTYLRTLTEIDLHDGDVSIVTYPAYPQTSVEARSMVEVLSGAGETTADNAEDEAGPQARRANRKRKVHILKLRGGS